MVYGISKFRVEPSVNVVSQLLAVLLVKYLFFPFGKEGVLRSRVKKRYIYVYKYIHKYMYIYITYMFFIWHWYSLIYFFNDSLLDFDTLQSLSKEFPVEHTHPQNILFYVVSQSLPIVFVKRTNCEVSDINKIK